MFPGGRDMSVRYAVGADHVRAEPYDPVCVTSGTLRTVAAPLSPVIRGGPATNPENYAEESCNPSGVT